MMSGEKIIITEQDFKNLAGKNGLIHISSCNKIINMASVSVIEEEGTEVIDRSKMTSGFLHDGTPVIKQFGEWVDANSPVDDNGRHTVKLDPHYYPETVRDAVATSQEWKRLGALPKSERLGIMLGVEPIKRIVSEFEPIKNLL